MTNWFLKEYCTIKYALFTQKKVHKPRKFCAHVVEMLKKIEQFFFVLEIISRLGSKIFTSNYLKKLLTSKIQNPKIPGSRLKNPDYKIQTPKSRLQNPDPKIQTTKFRLQNRLQNLLQKNQIFFTFPPLVFTFVRANTATQTFSQINIKM